MTARLDPAPGLVVSPGMLDAVPPVVRRYLTWAQIAGQPIPGSVLLRQTGRIRSGNDKPWLRFTADESFLIAPPAFSWLARVCVAGLPILRAWDSYVDGRGWMQIRVAHLFPLAGHRGGAMNEASLLRYLSEMVWFPAAFLLGSVEWRQLDDNSAQVTIHDAGLSATGTLRFDGEGRPLEFTALRQRYVGRNRFRTEPWIAAYIGYGERNGVQVPTEGWGGYRLPSGVLRYIELRVDT